jgi:tetrahydromethanopterin S-methyltransferase subunit G
MDKIDKLQKENSNNFKEINKRLDNIENRLDYIVSANNLKDIESK